MKKIFIVTALFPPEPVVSANLSYDIASHLSKNNKVTVIAPYPTRPYGYKFIKKDLKYSSFRIIRVNSYTSPKSNLYGRFRESFSFGIACKNLINQYHEEIDIIYMNSWPIFAQYFTIKTANKFKIPVINHIQDIYPESLNVKLPYLPKFLNKILLHIDKIILEYSNEIIAISTQTKKYITDSREIAAEKITVINNWQNEDNFNNLKSSFKFDSLDDNSFIFMYLGNIGPVAGVDLLIKSFISADLKNCSLVIAGSGTKKYELESFVRNRNINNIYFIDVPSGMVPEVQNKSDVLLLPLKKGASLSSIPSKLPAYMFSKKAIIGSLDLNSDSANVLIKSGAGWVVEPENLIDLKNKFIEVSKLDKTILEKKGFNGYKYAMNNFSKANNLPKVIKIFN